MGNQQQNRNYNKSFIKLLDYIGECPIESYKYK